MNMTPRQRLMLAALYAGETGSEVSPVQAQKLFFLIDRNAAGLVNGPHFNFAPYDYGPFDAAVYSELDWLSNMKGYVEVVRNGRYRTYRLTPEGERKAAEKLEQLDGQAQTYIGQVKDWVKSLSFRDLVSAVYDAYPEMRVNSIFRG